MGIGFIISGLCVSLLINIVYFSKERIKSYETRLYGYLIFTNLLGLFLEMACTMASFIGASELVLNSLVKSYLIYLVGWAILFLYYVIIISCDSYSKIRINLFKITSSLYLIVAIVISFLPIKHVFTGTNSYAIGRSVDATYFFTGIIMITILMILLTHLKKIKNRKYLPLLSFFVLGTIVTIMQRIYPELLVVTAMESFIMLIMYFTIENPDVKMIEQLNIAKETAEKANRAKSDFLSSMSHEIRTPLNAIVGFSDCIINANSLEEAKDNANDVVTASNTLLEIVNGILDISKIEAGKLELVESDYDTKKLFNDVVKLIRARIGDKPLDFKVNIAEDLPPVLYGDHINVKKIMINLLTNAVKYTDQGWISLDVKCVKVNDQICRLIVSVKDSGRGIKKEDIAKLFTKFQRVDEDRNTTIEGTGLGLAITKQLVKMMNGNIVVNSVYGEGSEFTVAIDQRLSLAKIEVEKEEVADFNLDLNGKKILIVDDNKLNIKVAEKILSKYNPTIDSCESGFECLEKVKLNNYDLILLDDMMPKMRGSEVLSKLKENPSFNTPVIMLTANAINGMEEQYLSKGFNGYLAKPIEKDKLYSILNKYLGGSNNIQKKETKVEDKITDYSNKKVLVVDDNKVNITITCNFLKPYKFNIDFCESGKECLEKSNNNYDLIFMDIMMPEMDGVETLHRLKENPNFNTIVIALTADAVEGAEQKYLNEGFDDYIAKPLIKDKLDKKIKRNINKNNINYLKEKGININSALELLGDVKTYNEILKEYVNGINEKITNLTNFKNNNDMENYAILVHSLKSESRYLGFDKLADICLQHELKSKENDSTYVNNNFNILLTELNYILDIVRQYLN